MLGEANFGIFIKLIQYMERQANQLAPRIRMPKETFTIKAKEYMAYFMKQINAKHTVNVMETVIGALEQDFFSMMMPRRN